MLEGICNVRCVFCFRKHIIELERRSRNFHVRILRADRFWKSFGEKASANFTGYAWQMPNSASAVVCALGRQKETNLAYSRFPHTYGSPVYRANSVTKHKLKSIFTKFAPHELNRNYYTMRLVFSIFSTFYAFTTFPSFPVYVLFYLFSLFSHFYPFSDTNVSLSTFSPPFTTVFSSNHLYIFLPLVISAYIGISQFFSCLIQSVSLLL